MTTNQQLIRENVLTELTWDLSTIFKDDQAFEHALSALKTAMATIQPVTFDTALQLQTTIETVLALFRQLETVYVYASLKNDQDTTNNHYQGYQAQVDALAAEVSATTAFWNPLS